ncbi:SRR1-like protein [Ceratobasidium sp. AG-Ba]|nr:SRR1-like protein [Ceratobasidium sp. AG-Ba]
MVKWCPSKSAEIVPKINRASESIVGSGDDDGEQNEVAASRWKCLCLGLGRPTSSIESRAQLCLLLDLCAELNITPGDTDLFDPAFEDADVAGLNDLGLRLMSENNKGAYVINTPTLVFMPHCDVELYERFFRANWSGDALARVLLVANDLQLYIDSTPVRKLEARSPCVAKLAPRLESTLFPPSTALPGAFNNTALQVLITNGDKHAWTWALPPDMEDGSDGSEVR